jgi:hypothetical protein
MRIQLTVAFAILGSVALGALTLQDQPSSQTVKVSVAGCVTQAEKTGSLADDTGTGVSSTPATAPVDANTAQPVNAYILTNADRLPADAEGPADTPTSYALVGHEQELVKHKGHRVEITGQLMPPRSAAGTTAGQTAASNIQRIAVAAIKMVSAECPARKQ